MKNFDLDIDMQTSFTSGDYFDIVKASMVSDEKLVSHPCGSYFQDIPIDSITRLSAIPYKEAEDLGFFKVDFLHLSIYDKFESRDEIEALIKIEPDWNLLLIPSVVEQLFQLSKHYELVNKVKPRNIIQLADCLALIRPSKRFMIDKYLANPENIRKHLYTNDENGYSFKKAHAISYALVVVLQLHLLKI